MGESLNPLGFLRSHFEGVKEHWGKNFAFLDYYKKTLGWEKPLPKWTDADVEEFIASDPVYGPQSYDPSDGRDPHLIIEARRR